MHNLPKMLYFVSAPRMYINGEEVTSDNLIDNDFTTCQLLPQGDGCRMDKVYFFLRLLSFSIAILAKY